MFKVIQVQKIRKLIFNFLFRTKVEFEVAFRLAECCDHGTGERWGGSG